LPNTSACNAGDSDIRVCVATALCVAATACRKLRGAALTPSEARLKVSGRAVMVAPVNSPSSHTDQRTPLYDQHRALSARIVPFAGWEMPIQYAGIVEEHRAVRERAGLFDVSHMGELRLRGPHAEQLVDSLVTNDVGKLAVGKALYTCCCNEAGTILDDLIIYRIAEGDVLVVCNASNLGKISPHFEAAAKLAGCPFEDQSAGTSLLALQGPRALEVLRAAKASAELLALPRFGVVTGSVSGLPVLAARTGYTGEDGVELFVGNGDAARLWTTLLAAGQSFGIQPIGLGARDTLRLEAALRLYGNDIDETTDPWEAGLGWVVKLDGREFVGRAALVERKQRGISRKLVGLEVIGRGIARHGYDVVAQAASGDPIGQVTSGSPSPTLGKNIALAYVPVALSTVHSTLFVRIRDKPVEARVVALPFYRRPG
ncbi:MAG: Aminomethyltransferase, partial [Myxococcaceae bacterium]|nr:Aminomethyltransferase [Myxococcaceae bacterium]